MNTFFRFTQKSQIKMQTNQPFTVPIPPKTQTDRKGTTKIESKIKKGRSVALLFASFVIS